MKIIEFCELTKTYIATLRVIIDNKSTIVRTAVAAETLQQALSMLSRIYGERNVFTVIECPRSKRSHGVGIAREGSAQKLNSAPSEPQTDDFVLEMPMRPRLLNPEEQHVKSMSDQAKRLQLQAKQIKAQDAVKRAQANLTKAISQKH